MTERITNKQVEEFLKDFEKYSETTILEEGKEKKEIEQIAKARGIQLKNSRDLAGFKTIYTFANKANKNRARLPKKALLKALPTLVGKPVDIDHIRRFVVGHYIDYRYHQKEDMVIAYGVFYKNNFEDEWEEAKKLFKAKKLTTSYEIWSPKDKRKYLSDGTYELLEQEIAGGALLFTEEPAFEDARVLELAKKNLEKQPEDLVYASLSSKYQEDELITSAEQITKKAFPSTPQKEVIKIKCSNCNAEIEHNGIDIKVKCPKCYAILNKEGVMQFPPQIRDFRVLCPSCKINNWLIMEKSGEQVKVKCLGCSKEYSVEFNTGNINTREILNQFNFLYTGRVNCLQCNKTIHVSGISSLKNRTLKCNKCGLEFPFNISQEQYKKITNIKELKVDRIEKSSEKGGDKTMEFKLELSKYHRNVDNFEKLEATLSADYGESTEIAQRLTTEQRNALPDSMFAVVVRVKDKRTGKMRKIRMFPINDKAHVRNALARLGQPAPQATLKRLGVSVEAVKSRIMKRAKQLNMKTLLEKTKKVSKKVEKAEVVNEFEGKTFEETHKIISDRMKEVKVEKADIKTEKSKVKEQPKAGEEPKAKETPKTEVKQPEKAKKESIEKAEKRITTAMIDQVSKEIETVNKKSKEEILQAGVNKLANQVIELKKKVELYATNAKEIVTRREKLGDFASELSDEELLDDVKFENATLKKQLAEKEVSTENANMETSEVVGDKHPDNDYYKKIRKKIDKNAFPQQ